ncbi:uncharacterized protein BDZ99DRAFT_539133 [Mytilinidion resinicola]|uniref:Uncharacterized protein n=1 Tax=Mytilinidion resinicola TaxID=574789 RepID=A0A6A6YAM8_9PEZI|nr:uncharacterized protein BDZ99DRAFT_539133 [Mytilinidion resinicola]KAF2805876.1 hypothetical protein BDZ99DRAFT_539133 [Mytilinidion resinicola]
MPNPYRLASITANKYYNNNGYFDAIWGGYDGDYIDRATRRELRDVVYEQEEEIEKKEDRIEELKESRHNLAQSFKEFGQEKKRENDDHTAQLKQQHPNEKLQLNSQVSTLQQLLGDARSRLAATDIGSSPSTSTAKPALSRVAIGGAATSRREPNNGTITTPFKPFVEKETFGSSSGFTKSASEVEAEQLQIKVGEVQSELNRVVISLGEQVEQKEIDLTETRAQLDTLQAQFNGMVTRYIKEVEQKDSDAAALKAKYKDALTDLKKLRERGSEMRANAEAQGLSRRQYVRSWRRRWKYLRSAERETAWLWVMSWSHTQRCLQQWSMQKNTFDATWKEKMVRSCDPDSYCSTARWPPDYRTRPLSKLRLNKNAVEAYITGSRGQEEPHTPLKQAYMNRATRRRLYDTSRELEERLYENDDKDFELKEKVQVLTEAFTDKLDDMWDKIANLEEDLEDAKYLAKEYKASSKTLEREVPQLRSKAEVKAEIDEGLLHTLEKIKLRFADESRKNSEPWDTDYREAIEE